MNNAIKVGLIVAVFLLSGCDAQNLTGNSRLTNGRACGGMVAAEAKACPHGGAPDPAPRTPSPTFGQRGRGAIDRQAEDFKKSNPLGIQSKGGLQCGRKQFDHFHFRQGVRYELLPDGTEKVC